jgi:hypothetical protein
LAILAVFVLSICCTFANVGLRAAPNPEPARNSVAAAREVAAKVYGAAKTGQDIEAYVAAVLEAFGIKAFSPNQLSTAAARLTNGRAVLLRAQLRDLANALGDGTLVSIKSFIAEMRRKGATVKATGIPLHANFCADFSLT